MATQPETALAAQLGARDCGPRFPEAIRRIIYTTNAIEALNAKRRSVRTRGQFPADDAATKLLLLVLRDTARAWNMPPRERFEAKTQFAIMFGESFVQA